MALAVKSIGQEINPLDNVEDVLSSNNWVFNRMTDEELMVQLTGKSCSYRVFFIWQEDMNALQFCAQYDFTIEDDKTGRVEDTLREVNETLWMGHFDLPKATGIPSYRHTCLMSGVDFENAGTIIEDLVDISLAQCERFYHAFHLLATGQSGNMEHLSLALMDTLGES